MAPNIVLLLTDEQRLDALGCAGNPVVQTPNLDRLASEGVRFSRMHTQGPLCQPARASLLTGRYVHEHGCTWNGLALRDPSIETAFKSLQAAGYETAVIGKTHFYAPGASGPDPQDKAGWVGGFGFDHVLEEYDKYAHVKPGRATPYVEHLRAKGLFDAYAEQVRELDWLGPRGWEGETSVVPKSDDLTSFVADKAIEWISSRRSDRPFCLWVSFVAPHVPFTADPEWAEFYRDADVPLPAVREPVDAGDTAWGDYLRMLGTYGNYKRTPDEDIRTATRQYYGMVSLIDERIGDIVEAVQARTGDTWWVFSSDHGEMLGSHGLWGKTVFYAPSVVVPAILRAPHPIEGRVVDALVESIDIPATLVDIAGAEPVGSGRSLTGAVEGEPVGRDHVISELGHPELGHYLGAVVADRYRYTYDFERNEACELFDLLADPDERENLVTDPTLEGVRHDLHDLIAHVGERRPK